MRPLTKWLFRLGGAAVIAGALAYIPYRVYGSKGYVHYRKLAADQRRLSQQNAALRAENARRAREIDLLEHDRETIRAVARDELGMVGPGEIVLSIEPARQKPIEVLP